VKELSILRDMVFFVKNREVVFNLTKEDLQDLLLGLLSFTVLFKVIFVYFMIDIFKQILLEFDPIQDLVLFSLLFALGECVLLWLLYDEIHSLKILK
jgi:hypothetical protein